MRAESQREATRHRYADPPRRAPLLALAALVLAALAGCAGDRASEAGSRELTVLAAASLTEAFDRIGRDFAAADPGTSVRFSYAGSSALAQQVTSGAPADVLAAASPATMKAVIDAGRAAGEPKVLARNVLQLAVPRGNRGGVRGLADLGREELRVALCAEQVPCGAAAVKALAAAGVTAKPDTLEQDVKAVLTKVTLGEVDAALVYRTDVLAAGDAVQGLDFPEAGAAVNDYPITALRDAPQADAARRFVDYVLSEPGQRVLREAGFQQAPAAR